VEIPIRPMNLPITLTFEEPCSGEELTGLMLMRHTQRHEDAPVH
jgi:hypothetical protein